MCSKEPGAKLYSTASGFGLTGSESGGVSLERGFFVLFVVKKFFGIY